jgi:hypothetical protein
MNAAQEADFAAADSEYKQIQSKLDTAYKLKEAEQQGQQQIAKLMQQMKAECGEIKVFVATAETDLEAAGKQALSAVCTELKRRRNDLTEEVLSVASTEEDNLRSHKKACLFEAFKQQATAVQ